MDKNFKKLMTDTKPQTQEAKKNTKKENTSMSPKYVLSWKKI